MQKLKINREAIQKYRFELSIFFVVFGIFILPRIPYVNLFFSYLIIFIIIIAAVLSVGFRALAFLRIGIALFLLMLLLAVSGDNFIIEHVANIAYFTILIGCLILFYDIIKRK